ncbi:argininosuccinate synthase [Candidatus Marsarchaeota G2 archaeon OSP_D]|jgi:argininosuccinate synthase|uniref:Argininosuccinate synthase n=4 Tax=Candidatus Marsarchaeota group 2 TaxID=2203771 RepID=A0A2R6CF32_9ARCH|nr:MAG: argininosuccinate synthase [Candidatus Marsarchaeota G2 archaeon OSP_D]PSN94031.1 MAG: argininosuccinate synthase [Candidatus Marsarchaeota G2 archaeon ECH_B_2]PSO00502.1 MAG: argininosuccinate synthase [Candidatus Marsarchaeota G2 archaeon ECH_B_1]PSO09421.1 MAG: argininosuccinate synthase [Candidatus Marsarchaeota G2 archaeon BE_D]
MSKTVVLAYSGGLDTSVSIRWLNEKFGYDVVTLTLDLGQKDDFASIEKRAYQAGAVKHYTVDVKHEFVEHYVHPSIKANALYQGKYPLSTALGRPLIAKKLVEVAEYEGAEAVAHGCTGKGNDQVRFDVTVRALNPDLRVIAPVREFNMTRDEELEYAASMGIPIEHKSSVYSIDQNLWGRSIEGGPIEDPYVEPPQEAFEWVRPVEETPDKPVYVEVDFEGGVPIAVDGERMDSVKLIEHLNMVGGLNGVGIVDHLEDRLVGIKSREVYEVPAALLLIEAHRALEKSVLTRWELDFKTDVEKEWAWLVYSGLWVEPLRMDLEGFINATQTRVSGRARLKLFKGSFRVVGVSSENSLYRPALATYSSASSFDQKASVGFVELWGLQSRVANEVLGGNGKSGRSGKKAEQVLG